MRLRLRMRSILRPLLAATLVAALLAACRPAPEDAEAPAASDLSRPSLAVRALAGHMRSGDFAAFARDAVPPDLHLELQRAWAEGRTRWPLDELPFAEHLPDVLGALAAADAETALAAGFDRNFADAARDIRAAAATLGMFGIQYVQHQGEFSESERDHYGQLVGAVAQWAGSAPLAERERAHAAIAQLAAAAREIGPATAEDIAAAGMDVFLARSGHFANAAKAVLAGYGLDLDAALDGVDASLQVQRGDEASVRLRYTLAGTAIDTLVELERIDGRWYLTDYLAHARAAAAAGDPAPAAMDPDLPAPPSAPTGAGRINAERNWKPNEPAPEDAGP